MSQQPAADSVEFYEVTERFQPDDVDRATHDPGRCNLPVEVCPACSAAERG
jgi:hypothetical protein